MIEILGYIASLFTITSFLMRDVIKLRIVNVIACIMFIIYGFYTNTLPIVFVNLIVAIINLCYIIFKNK